MCILQTAACARLPEMGDIMDNRLNKHLAKHLQEYVFLELMPDYVKREHLDFMRNVPMPVRKDRISSLAQGRGIEFKYFTMGMINIIGIDPSFKYVSQYKVFLEYINKDIVKSMVMVGIEQAKHDDPELACITLRAALVMEPRNIDALYNYMLVCRNLYLESKDKEYTADFKAEVFETLLSLQELAPELDKTYYYLGFAYVNAGKYRDAQIAWDRFLRLAEPGSERLEIRDRLREIEDPVRIEKGYQLVIGGKWDEGLAILEQYRDTERMDWWPLPYYLGVGYSRTERYEEAISLLKQALKGNPSSPEIMAELVIAHNALGDEVNAEKYKKKMDLVKEKI